MVLSSWQSHCESLPGLFDECRLSAEVAANPQTKPTDLDCGATTSYHASESMNYDPSNARRH